MQPKRKKTQLSPKEIKMARSGFIQDSHGNMLLQICYQIWTLDEVCRKAKCTGVLCPGTATFVTKNNTYSWNRRVVLLRCRPPPREAFMIHTQGSRHTGGLHVAAKVWPSFPPDPKQGELF